MKILNFKEFMKKYNLKKDTMNEPELQRVYIYPIYPRVFKKYSDKGSVNIDNGSQGGTHWTCFIVKDKKNTTLTHLVINHMNVYLNNYLNHYYIIIIKYKI